MNLIKESLQNTLSEDPFSYTGERVTFSYFFL